MGNMKCPPTDKASACTPRPVRWRRPGGSRAPSRHAWRLRGCCRLCTASFELAGRGRRRASRRACRIAGFLDLAGVASMRAPCIQYCGGGDGWGQARSGRRPAGHVRQQDGRRRPSWWFHRVIMEISTSEPVPAGVGTCISAGAGPLHWPTLDISQLCWQPGGPGKRQLGDVH